MPKCSKVLIRNDSMRDKILSNKSCLNTRELSSSHDINLETCADLLVNILLNLKRSSSLIYVDAINLIKLARFCTIIPEYIILVIARTLSHAFNWFLDLRSFISCSIFMAAVSWPPPNLRKHSLATSSAAARGFSVNNSQRLGAASLLTDWFHASGVWRFGLASFLLATEEQQRKTSTTFME